MKFSLNLSTGLLLVTAACLSPLQATNPDELPPKPQKSGAGHTQEGFAQNDQTDLGVDDCNLGITLSDVLGINEDYAKTLSGLEMNEDGALVLLAEDQGHAEVPSMDQDLALNPQKSGAGSTQERFEQSILATDQMDGTTEFQLAMFLRDCGGVEMALVIGHLQQAASKGYAEAQFHLGECYFEGRGVKKDEQKAHYWFQLAASQKHAEAHSTNPEDLKEGFVQQPYKVDPAGQYLLGCLYFDGKEIAKDEIFAAQCFRRAADQGDAPSQYKLGLCYFEGRGVEKNEKQAIDYFHLAADRGNADAQYNLAELYSKGEGVEKNETLAVKYYKLAAEQGHIKAQFNLGLRYYVGFGVTKNEALAVKYFQLAADKGHVSAQNNLGWRYIEGKGVEKDKGRAFHYFHLAAEQGSAYAQYNLDKLAAEQRSAEAHSMNRKDFAQPTQIFRKSGGYSLVQNTMQVIHTRKMKLFPSLLFKLGRFFNEALAPQYSKRAADQGSADTQFKLALCYDNGEGVEKDEALGVQYYQLALRYYRGEGDEKDENKALDYFQLAAEQGNADAQFKLGMLLYHGEGVEKDLVQAFKYWQLAANQGHRIAPFNIGSCYFNGKGVEKDLVQAFEYVKLAADGGYINAQFKLGMLLYKGQGVNKDKALAVNHWQIAADQGHIKAQFKLGKCYARGKGVEMNEELAFKYYKLAAYEGHERAQLSLGGCYDTGKGVKQNKTAASYFYWLAAGQGNPEICYLLAIGPYKETPRGFSYLVSAAAHGHVKAQDTINALIEAIKSIPQNNRCHPDQDW